MTLEQIRIFVAVAEHQHVTRAAAALHLAQSAASHAIASLEARYDARLFDRVGRRIELTEAGRTFLVEARAILARVEQAKRTLGAFGSLERGTLAVHASQTIASYWLPRHLVAFKSAFPGIDVRLVIGNTAHVTEAVDSGAADLGFVEDEVDNDRLVSTPVARDQLLLVVGSRHPWADGRRVQPSDLGTSDWIFREPGSGTRSAFERAIERLGVAPKQLRVVLELPSNESVRAAVETGHGATALSASVAAPSIEAGLLRNVAFALPERAFHSLRHQQRSGSRAAEALLAIIAPPADGRGRSRAPRGKAVR